MANINVLNNGQLTSSVAFQDALTSTFSNVTYTRRLNDTFNALRDFDRSATADFQAGGYLNSYTNGSTTTVVLDAYQIEMTGTLSSGGSNLSQYKITYLPTNDSVLFSGALRYSSLPMYPGSNLLPGSVIQAVAWSAGGAISWIEGTAVLQSDYVTLAGALRKVTGATLASGGSGSGKFYGQITDLNVSANYNLSNGVASFSGTVTQQSVGVANTSLTQLARDGTFNVSDYISIGGISENVNSQSIVDFYSGNDLVSISGSVGTTFSSGGGNDTVRGGSQNDSLSGNSGNDSIDGGDGTDVAIFSGSSLQYSTSRVGSTYTVSDTVSGRDGQDVLSNIELVQFSDKTIAVSDLVAQVDSGTLSITGSGTNSAGKSETVTGSGGIDKFAYASSSGNFAIAVGQGRVTVTSQSGEADTLINVERLKFSDTSIAFDTSGNAGKAYRVYKAAFARDPMTGDKAGLGFWISRIDSGMDMVEVAARFIDSSEFRSLYGQNPSNAEFLTKVYTNVLGRTPDEGGYSWWLNQLNTNPEKTRQKVLADFSESQENKDSVISLIGTGIQYSEFSG